MKHVYIVRHGITDASLIDTNHKDVSLNKKGQEQIRRLIPILPICECIYTSPTKRTLESSQILQPHSPIIIDHRLHNKDSESYIDNLKSLLHDLHQSPFHSILLVTHGRMIKFLYSICHSIPTNSLSIDYGHAFYSFLDSNGDYHFPHWNSLSNTIL